MDKKFSWEKQKIVQLITFISDMATVFKTTPWLRVVSDDPDNRILECAIEAEADFLVTGDKHLLKLGNYGNFEIIKLSPKSCKRRVCRRCKAARAQTYYKILQVLANTADSVKSALRKR